MKFIDAGTTWSKILIINEPNPEEFDENSAQKLQIIKDNEQKTGTVFIIPSSKIKKLNLKFDGATGHMVQNMLYENALFENEIIALAKGAMKLISSLQDATILDIGSRDAKWVKFKNGKYSDLDWNSACASSTGATVEMLCKFYDTDPCNISPQEERYTITCGIFGIEKIMDDIAKGTPPEICIARYINGLAYNMWNFAKRPQKIHLSGGFCNNNCFVNSLKNYCDVECLGRFTLLQGLFDATCF